MPAFTVTYTTATDPAGTFLQLTPAGANFSASAGGFDEIEIKNSAGSEITIEAVPLTCAAFHDAGDLMHFKIKDGESKRLALRKDLAGAFRVPQDFIPLLWQAKSKKGHADRTELTTRSRLHCQILVRS